MLLRKIDITTNRNFSVLFSEKFNWASEPRRRAKEGYETGGRVPGFFFCGVTAFSFYKKRKWGNICRGLAKSVKMHFSSGGSCSDKTIISLMSYDDQLRTVSITRGNAAVTNYSYDARNRVTNATTQVGSTATLQNMQYSYNSQDNISQISNAMNFVMGSHSGNLSSVYSYEYDGLDRLNDASGTTFGDSTITGPANKFYRHKFNYAANGNISQKQILNSGGGQIQNYSYNYSNHQVTSILNQSSVNRWSISYDAVGNAISKSSVQPSGPLAGQTDSQSMQYNAYNKISTVYDKDNNLAGEYQYADGQFRVYKKLYRKGQTSFANGETSLQAWNAEIEEIIAPNHYTSIEKKSNTITEVFNVYVNNIRIAAVLPNEEARYYLSDQINSVKIVLNDNGEPVKYTEFTAYGEEFISEGDEKHNPTFGSHEKDKESGYFHMQARHYDAEIGRFVQADIIIDGEYDTQGWNRYMYVQGNPIAKWDPTGRFLKHNDITREGAEMAGYDEVTVNELVKANTFRDTKDNIPIVKTFAYQNINHFDGLKNFADIEKVFKEKLIQVKDRSNKKSGEALHAIQDLYSHSNYTQLAKREFGDILVAPTFKQVLENKDKYSKFYQMLKKELHTGDFGPQEEEESMRKIVGLSYADVGRLILDTIIPGTGAKLYMQPTPREGGHTLMNLDAPGKEAEYDGVTTTYSDARNFALRETLYSLQDRKKNAKSH